MKKAKFAWLAVAVTLVAIIAIGSYYVFGGKDHQEDKDHQEEEQYWWQQDPEIVRVSEKFKGIDFKDSDRRIEGELLFPVITLGSSTSEVKALFGKPLTKQPDSSEPGYMNWAYFFSYDYTHWIDFTISDEGTVIDKGGI